MSKPMNKYNVKVAFDTTRFDNYRCSLTLSIAKVGIKLILPKGKARDLLSYGK